MENKFHWLLRSTITSVFVGLSFLGFGYIPVWERIRAFQDDLPQEIRQNPDSVKTPIETDSDTIVIYNGTESLHIQKQLESIFGKRNDTLGLAQVSRSPFISVQQALKGQIPGVYVQENNGEPGTIQSMLIRGLSSPVFSNKDVSGVQPVVYLNGIPLIENHRFVYDIQLYDLNPLGPANNVLSLVDLDNIESIEVIKDPVELARLGPLASNGAIWIVTKNGKKGFREILIDSYVGMVAAPREISPVNGWYEKEFRQQFYDRYQIPEADQYWPEYLRDEADANYFGKADWADEYYGNAPTYNFNAAISNGTGKANFRFVAGMTGDAGNADETRLQKTNIAFFVNMIPLTGVELQCMLSGGQISRERNRSLRDRFAEMEYLPDISTPVSPTATIYKDFVDEYSKSIDDNKTNNVQGYVGAHINKKKYYIQSRLAFDYNDNTRSVFWPSTILESVNYAANYSGYNQRIMWDSKIGTEFYLNHDHRLGLQATALAQKDVHEYNYVRAFDGSSDYNKTTSGGSYVMYRYIDKETLNLVSLAGNIDYLYKNILSLNMTFRSDAASLIQPDDRWLFSPAASVKWSLKHHFLEQAKLLSNLSLGVSWSRIGKVGEYNRLSLGPQYTSMEMNWEGQTVIPSYNGYAAITRPYTNGWVGYDLGWPVAEKRSIDLQASFFEKRLDLQFSLYGNIDENMVVRIPVPQEFGYQYQFQQGMDVSNRGVDLHITGILLHRKEGLNWDATFQLNYNKNELKKLPGGVSGVKVDGRFLQVGKSIDQFWVYRNEGIYQDESEVPVVNGKRLSINGVSFSAGDPRWADINRDNVIDENDKVLQGNTLPTVTGGLYNSLRYRRFDLGFQLHFALGHKALNYRSYQRYDFTTLDTEKSLTAVKEFFFWQSGNNNDNYPIYNPSSAVHPYREDQSLFLESLSYLKLRTVTLGYHFGLKASKKKGDKPNDNAYLYLSGNNLFTLTDFSGDDPELVNFNGYYTGYGLPIPVSVILGFRLNL